MGHISTPPVSCIPVVLLHTRPVMCEALRVMLERGGSILVVRSATTCEDLEREDRAGADTVVMELLLPVQRTLDLIDRLRAQWKGVHLLVVGELTDLVAGQVLRAGAFGVLGGQADEEEMRLAVRAAHAGGLHDNSWLRRQFGGERPRPERAAIARFHLSTREKEVLRLMAHPQGYTYGQIALRLKLGYGTITGHRDSIFNKLGVHKRFLALELARTHRLLDD